MAFQAQPVAHTAMLIRKPIAEVFEAFVDPAITARFWFTKGSDRLAPGKRVTWEWEMYGVSVEVSVKEIEENASILIEWGTQQETPTNVEWVFTPRGDGATFVSIKNWGFSGDQDSVVKEAIHSAGGFTLVLAGMKAYLEHGIMLNLIRDRLPDMLGSAGHTKEEFIRTVLADQAEPPE